MDCKFELNQSIEIAVSGERGKVIARAEYMDGSPCYLLLYTKASGDAAEQWWSESALRTTS